MACRRRGLGPRRGDLDTAAGGVVRAVVAIDDERTTAMLLDPAEIVRPRPARAGVGAVVGLKLPMCHDVKLVARNPAIARDVADQSRRRVDLSSRPRRLRGEAGVLDADGEMVALLPVARAIVIR